MTDAPKDWPERIEAHRGPKGGAMYMEPGHPGHVYHRYVRTDLVAAQIAAARREALEEAAGPARRKRWYVGSMNDACFIIDEPPRPAPADHLISGSRDVEVIAGPMDCAKARADCEAHNTMLALREGGE